MSYNEPNHKAESGEIKQTFEEIHAAIVANCGMVIDDHRTGKQNYADMVRKVHAIGKHGDDTVFLCSETETTYFCLNRMYIDDDGIPHLSRWSVGGVINLREHGTLAKAVTAYNDPANWVPGHKFTPVTDVVYL